MSDKPIGVGDLVVVHGCLDCGHRLGLIFKVGAIRMHYGGGYHCNKCGRDLMWPGEVGAEHFHGGLIPLVCLRRLDPDALKDDVPMKEELTA